MAVLAERVPADFLEAVLPWTLAAMAMTCSRYDEKHFTHNWRFWHSREPEFDSPTGHLLRSISAAARNLARSDPSALRVLGKLMLVGDFHAMQVVLGVAFASQPAEFAHDAAEFLCSDPRRLRLLSVGDGGWHSMDLIRAISPHWSSEDFARVERAILDLKPLRAKRPDDMRLHGQAQLGLLRALNPKRLSQAGRNLLGQLERKFPGLPSERPDLSVPEMKAVGPPIAEAAIGRMDDAGWLRAMKKYVSERDRTGKPVELSGGRIELSRALQAQAKEHPDRFWRLAMDKMDETYHPDYVAAIISGLAEAEFDVNRMASPIDKYLQVLDTGNIGQVISAIDKYAEKGVPDHLVALVRGWLLKAQDPKPKPHKDDQEKEEGGDRDLVTEGMNTDRGAAMWTLAKIMLTGDRPRRAEYLDLAEEVVEDPSAAVRAVCIRFLPYAMSANPHRACFIFRRLVGTDHTLLREEDAYNFIYHSLHRHAEEVLWAIQAMLADQESDKAREAGAKLACLAAFRCTSARPLRDSCLVGEVPLRKGAAAIYATNFAEPTVGKECRERLLALTNDDDHEVRDAAANFWHHMKAADIRDLADFLREWANTKSLDEGADAAADALEEHATVNLELTLDLAWRIVDALGAEITNFQTRRGMISHALTPAVLNVYHRSLEAAIRARAIDLFERLEELGCPEVREALEAADRL
jgi:hypothetical protein